MRGHNWEKNILVETIGSAKALGSGLGLGAHFSVPEVLEKGWDLPNPGIKPGSLALQADALSTEPPGKTINNRKIADISPNSCTLNKDF